MSESLPPTPALCLSREALENARAYDIAQIGYNAFQYAATLDIIDRRETPPAVIAIGGIAKGIDCRISYDPNQPYHVAISPDNESSRLDDPSLPRFRPTEEQLANMIVCPIPRAWTSAELSQLIVLGSYKPRSIWKFAALTALMTGITAGITGAVATPFLHKAGYEVSYKNMTLGLACLFSLAGLAIGGVVNLHQGNPVAQAKEQARRHRPFPVWDSEYRLL